MYGNGCYLSNDYIMEEKIDYMQTTEQEVKKRYNYYKL